MSFELQPERKRQSCQKTKIRPFLSISADGSGSVRRLPATLWSVTVAIVCVALQLAPPSDDVNSWIALTDALAIGTTTVPFGRTSGWPPRPVPLFAVVRDEPQVSPPSVEVFISIRLPTPLSSHSV